MYSKTFFSRDYRKFDRKSLKLDILFLVILFIPTCAHKQEYDHISFHIFCEFVPGNTMRNPRRIYDRSLLIHLAIVHKDACNISDTLGWLL